MTVKRAVKKSRLLLVITSYSYPVLKLCFLLLNKTSDKLKSDQRDK